MTYPAISKKFEAIQVKFQTKSGFYDLKIKENGYLGKPNVNGNFVVWVRPFPGDILIQVEANKSAFIKDDEATRRSKRKSEYDASLAGWYRLVFPTTFTENGIICTKFARENDFRILRAESGGLEMSQISVVSQNGRFYLFFTPQYSGEGLLGKDGVYIKNCPNLDPSQWKQLQPILKELVEGQQLGAFDGHQPKQDKYQPDAPIKASSSERMIGKVRWYNPSLRYGLCEIYLLSADKKKCRHIVNARVYEGLLVSAEYPRILCAGDLLEVRELTQHVANTREFKTRFKYDIVDCTLFKRGEVYKSSFTG